MHWGPGLAEDAMDGWTRSHRNGIRTQPQSEGSRRRAAGNTGRPTHVLCPGRTLSPFRRTRFGGYLIYVSTGHVALVSSKACCE